jgi:nicotinate-nucleotide pyrophosphorylase (carboxylating)
VSFDLKSVVENALKEDMPKGDVTTSALPLSEIKGRARLIAKEDLIVSGTEPFAMAFQLLDYQSTVEWHISRGQMALRGQSICTVKSSLSCLLSAERVALNFLGRLSGIATLTKCFVNEVHHTSCRILDTRKTTPGLRFLEKSAVVDGGGQNHRMNLSDAILVKENHIQAMGGITPLLTHLGRKPGLSIEIEIKNLSELQEAVKFKIDRVMFDNMTNEQMAEALKFVPASIKTEASGNMSIERVKSVAELGVDFISVGALTHSAPCADVSLLIE